MRQTHRVNFGNGQVHYAGSLEKCRDFIKNYGDAWSFLERAVWVESGDSYAIEWETMEP